MGKILILGEWLPPSGNWIQRDLDGQIEKFFDSLSVVHTKALISEVMESNLRSLKSLSD